MPALYNAQAPKKAANLSINSDLLSKARSLDINLSSTLEQALVEALKTRQREVWLEENREAIAAYNQHVEEHGVFSDGLRRF
ncbi:type II toxin-antitoxin system CcdA family antitoxin [Pseudomonas sp. TUM22785]|uniref:type II toxin-antitoxin system CcdA family antitoxin n=1 Tax=Pseudomonas sp. TUM22785 TaxID=3019098 RepID=UPI0023050353|nr:type II toxin-antitoxin system CcdA family antitoxin [Pseudomonas sp. TUM22785]WCD81134.1 type II toxin-antitoxin system CcdA family antitoxin [Pseudomonas sp. TUM22785]